MGRLIVPGRRPLLLPGTTKRVQRRPSGAGLIMPHLSGAPLSTDEIDYDELDILRQWREYAPDASDQVRYFCYELAQTNPGAPAVDHYFKAVRLIRLTRVPRYLRQQATTEQFRDLLAGLREKHVLFLNIVAKSPSLPLVFAYGVQGVGETIEEARVAADEAFAALTFSLDGTYQQLEYQPLTVAEGETLTRYQNQWRHIAVARGRPMPSNAGIGASSVLDGNRTDVQSTNDAIAAFVRGMGDKSFMLSLITVPLTPEDMSHAWRNITMKLSAVRSDQQGSRSLGASFALPLGLGSSLADGSGTTHGLTGTSGVGSTDGLSASSTEGLSVSHSDGVSASQAESVSVAHSVSATESATQGVTESATESVNVGQSVSQTQGSTDSLSVGMSESLSDTRSVSESAGVSQGQSLGVSNSASADWSSGVSQGLSAGQTLTDNWSQGFSESLTQTWGLSAGQNSGANQGASEGGNASIGGGLDAVGLNASLGETWQNAWGSNMTLSNGSSVSAADGASASSSVGSALANSLTQSAGLSESVGGSVGQSITGTSSVGANQSITAGQSLGVTQGQSVSQGTSLSSSSGIGASLSQGASTGQSLTAGQGQSISEGMSTGNSSTATRGASATDTVGASVANTSGASTAQSTQQAVSDAWMVAMSRQASQTGSFGVVPGMNATISKATFDEAKRSLGDVLEAQMRRYQDGIEGGGLLYQMFLVTEDQETLTGAASLLKAAFWGPGGAEKARLVQPFHTIVPEDAGETHRLLLHAAALTHYRRREPVMDLIEPHLYSSFVTTGEAAVFCAPPTSEALGLMSQTDSMPVFAMPFNRAARDMYLGHVVNGERGKVSDARFGVDLGELTHMLIQGATGMGKTSTMMRLLEQAVALRKVVTIAPTMANPVMTSRTMRAGVLCFDWMNNMRDLASVVEPDRFQLFSVSKPSLGAFRWNPLEIPHPDMSAHQWLGAQADQLAASFGLGEVGRSLLAEKIDWLYLANRLEPFVLRERKVDPDTGTVLRSEITLPPVDRADLPPGAVQRDAGGNEVANVYSYAPLSRLVSLEHLAILIVSLVEELATPEGARAMGTVMRDRVQSVWRRIQYYAPGGPLAAMVAADPDLRTRQCLGVRDIIDPERGLVTVIETDGLDQGNRRVILGSVMLAVYRYGLHVGKGAFDNKGQGPGTFLVLEEAHELFGTMDEGEDRDSVKMRANLYESMFRRARATGLRLVAMTQNCGAIPSAITSQTTTVIVHRTYDANDRSRVCDLFSWDRSIVGQLREIRYLGEMPRGYALVRLDARDSYLESAPVHILVDPPVIAPATEELLASLAISRAARLAVPA